MENKISTFKKEKYDIITFVERKFGFCLSLDFKSYGDLVKKMGMESVAEEISKAE